MMLVFDNETTGLLLHPEAEIHKQPRIIEFGAALLSRKTGEVVDQINILINPGGSLPPEIVKITGITDDDLKDAPPFAEALPRIVAFFAQAEVMVAHNLPFDQGMVQAEILRFNVAHGPSEWIAFQWPRGICTVGLYKDVWGRNPKMTELYAHVLGKPLAQTHRAIDDVMALVEIIQAEELWKL